MSPIHHEYELERHIVERLAAAGWLDYAFSNLSAASVVCGCSVSWVVEGRAGKPMSPGRVGNWTWLSQ